MGGGLGSPGKSLHYHTNGTGRDSYIHVNQGGFANHYSAKNDRDCFVESLRGYAGHSIGAHRQISKEKRMGQSPQKDHFVEGQISIRSPKARNGLNMLRTSQKWQAERLAMPQKRRSQERLQDI